MMNGELLANTSLEEIIKSGDVNNIHFALMHYDMLYLELDDYAITDIEPLAVALQGTRVMELSLTNNPISNIDFLIEALPYTNVNTLWLDRYTSIMPDTAVEILAKVLPTTQVRYLFLRDIVLSSRALQSLTLLTDAANTIESIIVSDMPKATVQKSQNRTAM